MHENPLCDHVGHRRYVRRIFSNGSSHICVQCQRCGDTVRMPEHNFKPYVKLDEVPSERAIGTWLERIDRPLMLKVDE